MPPETLSIIHYAVVEDLKDLKLSTRDVARRNGVSAPTLYKIARIAEVDMAKRDEARIEGGLRGFGIPPYHEHRDDVILKLREGMLTAKAIVDLYGVSMSMVSNLAKELNIQIGRRRILKGQLENLNLKKTQLEERLASVNAEIAMKQELLVGKE